MQAKSNWTLILLVSSSFVLLSSCQAKVVKNIPPDGTVWYNQKVYVENDGRCPEGQVIKVTGGNLSKKILRKYECVQRP